jgi:hypothetical protein
MKSLLIIPVLFLCIFLAGLVSCAEDEVLLPSDSTYMGLYPVDDPTYANRAFDDYMANRYLKITPGENRMLFMADSLQMMHLAEVVVPEGGDVSPGSYNFGWPVGAMSENTIIISTQRKLLPGQTDDKSGKGQLLVISNDAGMSWNAPIEVQNLQPYGYRVGSQSCLGSVNGVFIQKGSGTLISESLGENWAPYPRAFKFATQESYGSNGPRIHLHPAFGLIFLTGTDQNVETGSVFRSDDGTDWEDTFWSVGGGAPVNCPGPSALILEDGSILMVSSNGRNMVQYYYSYSSGDTYGDIQFRVDTITEIITSLSAYDVPDLILNPVSGRIELTESNPAAMLLWSIDPSELAGGSTAWEFETILLKRDGISSMHPAGSVVDSEKQLHHYFLYMGGAYPDRNCIFSLSRSLDTDALTTWINDTRASLGI